MGDDFSEDIRAAASEQAHDTGPVATCAGHYGYPCLGVKVSETDGVYVEVHYNNSPETQRRWRKVVHLLALLLDKPDDRGSTGGAP